MFSSKKGMALQEVGKLLLLLIGAIVLIFILIYFFAPNLMDDFWPCRLNVLFRTKISGVGITSPLDLRMCKTHHNELSEKDADKIAGVLADRLGNCWGKYWNGKVDFFSDWDFGGSDHKCMICNVDKFKNFDGEIDVAKIVGLMNTKDSLGQKIKFANQNYKLKISEDIPVYTTFVVHKIHVDSDTWKSGVIGGATGAAAGFLVGCVVGGVSGSVVPIFGNIIGCFTGGAIGATAAGTVIGVGFGAISGEIVHIVAKKGAFIPQVYLFNSDISKVCDTLE